MALLIVRNGDGVELGRREMHPIERFALYRACSTRELFRWGHGQFVVNTVAWRLPEEHCLLGVTFDSWAPVEPVETC